MKQFSMLGILFLFSYSAIGQIQVKGRVLDEQTNESIPFVTITAEGIQTLSDKDGRFSFEIIEEGPVIFKLLGYQEKMIPIQSSSTTLEVLMQPTANPMNTPSTVRLQTIEVSALRATDDVPVAKTNLNEADIENEDVGRDMPYILENTASVVTTSQAGAGVGYTGLRIRGSDQSRINVTINGVPVNDAESQGVFWVNTPDLASSVSQLQVQRGVGTSTNGAGAFGASINMETKSLSQEAYSDLHIAGGSFNTQRYTLSFGTGLMGGHWTLDGRASRIKSDGYIDRASSDLRSYYLALGYIMDKTTIKAVVFGGRERTYQAWNGIDSASFKENPTGNSTGAIYRPDGTIDYYDNQVDNYGQDYYQLHINHEFSETWSGGVSGFYTRGLGHYEEYQQGQAFADYGLNPIFLSNDTINTTDLTRRLWLDNHYYGVIANIRGSWKNMTATFGGAWNQYDGDHYGEIIWARYASDSEPEDRFYDNNSLKSDFNVYAKLEYSINSKLAAYADLQLRTVSYSGAGIDEGPVNFDFGDELTFFNPKVGLVYRVADNSRLYASYAVANREPSRRDYRNAIGGILPKPERLQDVEVGYEGGTDIFSWNLNGYFMYYTDQLVLTGEIDNVGTPIRENVGESYRAGIEISSTWNPIEQLTIRENITVSTNQNINYIRSIGDTAVENLGNTPVTYSPNLIASLTAELHLPLNLNLEITPRYVSEQHLTNTGDESLTLPSYFITDMRLSGSWSLKGLKRLRAYVMANNLFSREYASDGYVYAGDIYFYPQAPLNYMFGVELSF